MADERTNNWPLVGSPIPMFLIIFSYFYFVLKCGPEFMKNRPAYSLKTYVRCYNAFQIIVNAWAVKALLDAGWFTETTIYCEPVRYTYEPGPYKMAKVMWWVMLIKLIDLSETGVFVLRKKYNQVSTLHLYHHVSTLVIQWLYTKYIAGSMTTFVILTNCSVHVIMYSYYLLSTWPSTAKLISFFKRYITIIQITQLVILLIYTLQSLNPSCPVPRLPGITFVINLAINIYLFVDFYRKSYARKQSKKVN